MQYSFLLLTIILHILKSALAMAVVDSAGGAGPSCGSLSKYTCTPDSEEASGGEKRGQRNARKAEGPRGEKASTVGRRRESGRAAKDATRRMCSQSREMYDVLVPAFRPCLKCVKNGLISDVLAFYFHAARRIVF